MKEETKCEATGLEKRVLTNNQGVLGWKPHCYKSEDRFPPMKGEGLMNICGLFVHSLTSAP